MILRGFKFGMLLQIAIGPVCIFIIKTAIESGIVAAEAAVLAATLMDTLFVTLAIIGIGPFLEKRRVQFFMKYFGTVVLVYFGFGIILGSIGIQIIPSFVNSDSSTGASNAFITSFILTASSPLSILFWTGVFATKIASEDFGKNEMILFGVGAVLATLGFLGILALILGILHQRIPDIVVSVLNISVGIVLLGFAMRMFFKREMASKAALD